VHTWFRLSYVMNCLFATIMSFGVVFFVTLFFFRMCPTLALHQLFSLLGDVMNESVAISLVSFALAMTNISAIVKD